MLAARNAAALEKLAADLGGAETAVADVTVPDSVRALPDRGDVLVTTVGPFLRYGGPALAAAVAAGAHYFDSTGEGPFISTVFDRDDEARKAGVGLLTAFGFDFVSGDLAAGLASREAPDTVRAEIGYFIAGPGASGGTRASMAGMLFRRGFALRGGRIVPERTGSRIRTFAVSSRPRTRVSIPGSEHLALSPHLPAAARGRRPPRPAARGRSCSAGRLLAHRRGRTGGAGEMAGRRRAGTRREGLDRRPGARSTGSHALLGGRRGIGRHRPRPGFGDLGRGRSLRLHQRDPRLGAQTAACTAPVRWARSRRSVWRRSPPPRPMRGFSR